MKNQYIIFAACTLFLTGCTFQNQTNSMTPTPEPPVIVYETEDYQNAQMETPTPTPDETVPEMETVYDPVNKVYTKETKSAERITLAFGGDICFHDDFSNMNALRARENGIYDCISENLMTRMKDADIFMVNNEFPYSNRGTPTLEKTYTFRSKPENVTILDDMGVDVVSLANNHAYDYGAEALADSIDILNEAKVPFAGAGKNIEEAMKPVYFVANQKRIAIVSASQIERLDNPDTKEATETTPGVLRTLNPEKCVSVIEEAENNSDFVVVYVHWGSENTDLVEASQRDLAAKYVEAGADLIIGDHPHCLQGIDYIEDVPVFYSLGNFWFNSKTMDTCLVEVALGQECNIESICFVPCIQQDCKTRLAEEGEAAAIINYMQGISNYAAIDADGYVTKSDTNHNTQNGQNTSPTKKTESLLDPAAPVQDGAVSETSEEDDVE